MANKRASISAGLRADATGWTRGLNQARADTMKLKKDVEATKINGPRMNVPSPMHWKASAAAGVAGAAAIGKAFFDATVTVESLQNGLLGVSDGSETVKAQMEAIAKLSEKPGLDMAGAGKASIALQDVGLSAAQSRDYISEWANKVALASGGAEEFKGVMMAVTQILGKQRVEQEELNQIKERVPIASLIAGLDDLRDKPRAFLDALLVRMKEMPRATANAKKSVDQLKDSFTQMMGSGIGQKVTGGISSLMDFGSGIMKGKGLKGSFDEVYNKAAESTAGRTPELTQLEIDRRREGKAKAAADTESAAREKVNEAIREMKGELESVSEMERAIADGNKKTVAELEDQKQLQVEIAKLKKDGLKVDEDQIDAVRRIVAARRADKDSVQAIKNQKDVAKSEDELRVANLRHLGKNKKADRMEDKAAVKELTDGGMDEKSAKFIVDRRRDLAEDEALGPGRRRVRNVKAAPKVEIPRESAIEAIGAPGAKRQPARQAETASTGAENPETIRLLKSIDQKLTPGANQKQKAVNR